MKKVILALAFILAVCTPYAFGQCPQSKLFLFTQADVDSVFIKYSTCSSMPVDVQISRSGSGPGIITDLSPLSFITHYQRKLSIGFPFESVISGFENVTAIDGQLFINSTGSLSGIEVFTSLTKVGALSLSSIHPTSIKGPSLLSDVDHLFISLENVTSIDGFDGLTKIDSSFLITRCNALTDISGFNNLVALTPGRARPPGHSSYVAIRSNEQLQDISGFNSLEFIHSDLHIEGNSSLQNISGFSALRRIEYDLLLAGNKNLINISGMKQLDTIAWEFEILNNGFIDLNWLPPNLTVLFRILLRENEGMTSLNGVADQQGRIRAFTIEYNENLTDCKALCEYINDQPLHTSLFARENGHCCINADAILSSCYDFFESSIVDLGVNLSTGQTYESRLPFVSVQLHDQDALLEERTTMPDGTFEFNTEYYEDGIFRLDIFDPINPEFIIRHNNVWENSCNLGNYDFPLNIKRQIDTIINRAPNKTIALALFNNSFQFEEEVPAINYEPYRNYFEQDYPIIDTLHALRFEAMRRILMGGDLSRKYEKLFLSLFDAKANVTMGSFAAISSFYQQFNRGQLVREQIRNIIESGIVNGSFDKNDIRALAMAAATKNFNQENLDLIAYYSGYDQNYQHAYSNSITQYLSFGDITSGLNKIGRHMFRVKKEAYKIFRDSVSHYLPNVIIDTLGRKSFAEIYADVYNTYSENYERDSILLERSNEASANIQQFNLVIDRFTQLKARLAQEDPNYAEGAQVLNEIITLYKNRSLLTRAAAFGIYANVFPDNYWNTFNNSTQIIGERNGVTATYPSEFLHSELANYSNFLNNQNLALSQFQTSLNSSDFKTICTAYYQFSQQRATEPSSDRILQYLSVLSNEAFDDSLHQDDFYIALDLWQASVLQRMVIDGKMSAYFLDTTNHMILNELQFEVDTLITQNNIFTPIVQTILDRYDNRAYEAFIAVNRIEYPDSLLDNRFELEFEIKNFGPLTSDSFEVVIHSSSNARIIRDVDLLDTVYFKLGPMALLDSARIRLDIQVEDEQEMVVINLSFKEVNGFSKTIPVVFDNVKLTHSSTNNFKAKRHNALRAVPNPVAHETEVLFHDEPIHRYELYSSMGAEVKRGNGHQIDMRSLTPGLYFCRAEISPAQWRILRLIKM